ncbi:hypothetical protein [Haloferula sp.]|uniref:hypothetical protein n=1 Tax=Haloferula sp. TaxID=2497595 RepID=UPI00329F1416
MKPVSFAFRGVLFGLLATSANALDAPILSTPGSATWADEVLAGGGTRTTFTITEDTVLDWNQFNLEAGNELVFDFVGGNTVVNNLNGTSRHRINGDVTSNGIVGFFSPNAKVTVGGNITAKGVTIATLGVDSAAFASGSYALGGGSGKRLTVSGGIQATDGDVLLAGKNVVINDTASISASGAALFAGGEDVVISSGGIQRVNVIGSIGNIVHNGTTNASSAEAVAGGEITNSGQIDVGAARLFMEVGNGGRISNEGNGVLVGATVFNGALLDDGIIIRPNEGDVPPLVGESRLKVPSLKRPNGSKITKRQTVSYSAPMSARSDAGRASKSNSRQVAKVDSSKSLLKRSSFFGARGGKTVASR